MAAASSGKSKGSSGRETSKYDAIELSNIVKVPFFGLTHILLIHRLHELAEQQRWGEQQ